MRSLIVVVVLIVGSLSLASCVSVTDTPANDNATAQTHFYPGNDGVVYTYSRYANNRYDTIACKIKIGTLSVDKDELVIIQTGDPLYYFRIGQDAGGNQAGILERGDTTLLALDGALVPGATWTADQTHSVQATVVDRYDDYYLKGRVEHFADVLVVKYHTTGLPDNVYTLRFFARGHGLILERQLAPYGEVASLQLISIQSP